MRKWNWWLDVWKLKWEKLDIRVPHYSYRCTYYYFVLIIGNYIFVNRRYCQYSSSQSESEVSDRTVVSNCNGERSTKRISGFASKMSVPNCRHLTRSDLPRVPAGIYYFHSVINWTLSDERCDPWNVFIENRTYQKYGVDIPPPHSPYGIRRVDCCSK